MPHIPDTNHDTHDLELVAAYAAGDAGADAARAETLIASCTDCAALADDLRAIAAALPSVPVPQRPRDFRLTSEQAAALRPRGIRGLLAALSGPKFAFATPLGTGLAALGIVGVLVASGGLPFGSGGASQGTNAVPEVAIDGVAATSDPAVTSTGAGGAAMAPAESPADASSAPVELAIPAPSAAPSEAPAFGAAAATAAPLASSTGDGPASTTPDEPRASGDISTLNTDQRTSQGEESAKTQVAAPSGSPLLIPAATIVLAGLVLVLLRAGARRLA